MDAIIKTKYMKLKAMYMEACSCDELHSLDVSERDVFVWVSNRYTLQQLEAL